MAPPEYGDPTVIKQRAGVDPNDLHDVQNTTDLDALIVDLNQRASEGVERWCNRDFEDHPSVTETIDGNGRLNEDGNGSISLPGSPVRSVSTVKVDGNTIDSSEYRIKESKSYEGVNAGILERKNAPWPEGWENIEITFTYGFTDPPAGVRSVVEDLVIDSLRAASRNESAESAESVSMDGFSVTYFTGRLDREAEHKDRLQKYKRLALARS